MSMSQFFTREASMTGIELPLYLPGTDTKSGEWIRVRGVDSDEFRIAEIDTKRRLAKRINEPGANPAMIHIEEMRLLISSLVVSWSFPEECTMENVVEFLRQAPQIQEVINRTATQRSHFLAGSSSSENMPEPSSN